MLLYSRTCAYAIRAMTWLALCAPAEYRLAETLGREVGVPRHFLVKILQQLARQGLLASARGRGGGFALARSPDAIMLLEIVEAVDGTESLRRCVVGLARCDDQQPCPQHEAWRPICERIGNFLQQTTLADMSLALSRKLDLIGADTPAEAAGAMSSAWDLPSFGRTEPDGSA